MLRVSSKISFNAPQMASVSTLLRSSGATMAVIWVNDFMVVSLCGLGELE